MENKKDIIPSTIIRHSIPTKYDSWPFGTVCKSIKIYKDEFDIYVQVSHTEDSPIWESVGTFNKNTEGTVQDEVSRIVSLR